MMRMMEYRRLEEPEQSSFGQLEPKNEAEKNINNEDEG